MAQNQLSWPSAFWGLAGIALNTMFQDGASYFASTPEIPIYVPRASPIACLFDILSCFIFVATKFRRYGFKKSLQALAIERHENQENDKSEASIANRTKGMMILVIAILQSIKLLACTGIPWTKAYTLIFVLLYLLETGLRRINAHIPATVREQIKHDNERILADHQQQNDYHRVSPVYLPLRNLRQRSQEDRTKFRNAMNGMIFWTQVAFWFYATLQALPKSMDYWSYIGDKPMATVPLYQICLEFICVLMCALTYISMAIVYIGFLGAALRDVSFPVDHWLRRLQVLVWLGLVVSLAVWVINNVRNDGFIRVGVVSGGFGLVLFLGENILARIDARRSMADRETRGTIWITSRSLALLVVHVTVTAFCFWRVYDVESTYKPAFADYLG